MNLDRVPRHVAGFHLDVMDGEVLLYHPGLTRALRLNETAALVWRLCDGRSTIGDIAGTLGDVFPQQADAVRMDVVDVVARLEADGAIEVG